MCSQKTAKGDTEGKNYLQSVITNQLKGWKVQKLPEMDRGADAKEGFGGTTAGVRSARA